MRLEDVQWLTSPAGADLLATLPPYAAADTLRLQSTLRAAGLSPERVAALLTQHQLRARAERKFGSLATGLLLTPDGLEQATRWELAAAHAQRFRDADVREVLDLGCGIGADAMAFASLGMGVTALDRDPVTAALAEHNLARWPSARVRVGEIADLALPAGSGRVGAWLDPARRVAGVADLAGRAKRLHRLEELSPPWSDVLGVAAALPATGVKLAPSFPDSARPEGAEAQWVSWAGEVLECVVWCGPLAQLSGRSALILRPGAAAVSVSSAAGAAPAPLLDSLGDLGDQLYEVDRAVLQANLTATVTAAVDGRELGAGIGYVSSSVVADVPGARRYQVLEAMPFQLKAFRAWLRGKGITGLTIKARGVPLDEDALRRQLKIGRGAGSGDQALVLLTRVAGRPVVLVLARPASGSALNER